MLYVILKRILDITVALVALTLFSPILLIVIIATKFDGTKSSVFCEINDRVGKENRLFFMFKFRSMVKNAHTYFERHPEYKDLEKEWKKVGKLPINVDPRITKMGKFIRKTDIDEFAQFINVLKGNMSVVGPRAPYPEELERYIEAYPEIKSDIDSTYSVKPGITGVWQISGRNKISIPDRFKMEAEYARRKNIFEDLKIIIMTPISMITRKGAMD